MGRDLVLWNVVVLMNIYIPIGREKAFSCTIFANISIWEAVLLQIKFIKKCIWGVGWKSCW